MKKMACKICGSTDITVDGDTVSCESCGNKYTLPTSKNSNKVHKVKADKTEEAVNFLKRAQDFYDEKDFEEVLNYCDKVLDIDADNVSAIFLKSKCYFGGNYNRFEQNLKKVHSLVKSDDFDNKIKDLIDETFEELKGANNPEYIFSRCLALVKLQNSYNQFTKKSLPNKKEIEEYTNNALKQFYSKLEKCAYADRDGKYYGDEFLDTIIELLKLLNKSKALDTETQKHILTESTEYLAKELPLFYQFYSEGKYHTGCRRETLPNDYDKEQFEKMHTITTSFAKDIIENCPHCDFSDKLKMAQVLSEHYELFSDISWTVGGSEYTFSEKYISNLQKEKEYYDEIIKKVNERDSLSSEIERKGVEKKEITSKTKNTILHLPIYLIGYLILLIIAFFMATEHIRKDDSNKVSQQEHVSTREKDVSQSFKTEVKQEQEAHQNSVAINDGSYVCGINADCNSELIMEFENHQPLTGIVKIFYENGTLYEKISVRDGLKDGIFEKYYENGVMKRKTLYKNGRLNGELKEYYYNGNLKMVASFENDKLNGVLKRYDERRMPIAEMKYEKGKKKKTSLREEYILTFGDVKFNPQAEENKEYLEVYKKALKVLEDDIENTLKELGVQNN